MRAPRSPFRKLPEDIIRDIVLYLGMKDRARFGATNKRHYDIDIRAGFREMKSLKIAFDAKTCKIICKFANYRKSSESIRFFEGDQFTEKAFLFVKNATVGVCGFQALDNDKFISIFDDAATARMVEQCQQLNINFKKLNFESLQAFVQCVQRHPENSVSLWDCSNSQEAVTTWSKQTRSRVSYNNAYYILADDPMSTIVMSKDWGSKRIFIANVPRNQEEYSFVRRMLDAKVPNHRKQFGQY